MIGKSLEGKSENSIALVAAAVLGGDTLGLCCGPKVRRILEAPPEVDLPFGQMLETGVWKKGSLCINLSFFVLRQCAESGSALLSAERAFLLAKFLHTIRAATRRQRMARRIPPSRRINQVSCTISVMLEREPDESESLSLALGCLEGGGAKVGDIFVVERGKASIR